MATAMSKTSKKPARTCRNGRGPSYVRGPLALVAVLALAGCAGSPDAILNRRPEDGRTVRELTASDITTALLVYDPATCIACGTPLASWEALARQDAVKLVLLLAGPVSHAGRRVLRIRRIPVSGILKSPRWRSNTVPSECLVQSGVVRAKAEGRTEIRNQRLWTHPLIHLSDPTANLDPSLSP